MFVNDDYLNVVISKMLLNRRKSSDMLLSVENNANLINKLSSKPRPVEMFLTVGNEIFHNKALLMTALFISIISCMAVTILSLYPKLS